MASNAPVPAGFRFGAVAAGIKYPGRLDLAMASMPGEAAAAALFTTNRVKAAPLIVGAKHLRRSASAMRAIIVNSGNANCATGKAGVRACKELCSRAAKLLECREVQILPSSTGVIGMPLPAGRVLAALPELFASLRETPDGLGDFARAIMTTDTRPKLASSQFVSRHGKVTITGVAKGAGMIHPNMATMLAYVFTDAAACPEHLRELLTSACRDSFNAISVDGDTSTNDTLALFASGASGIPLRGRDERSFFAGLKEVCNSLASQIVSDGEGVKHVVRLTVEGARMESEARAIANTIATSMLVKTAWAGADPNWGRILAAVGRAGIPINPSRVNIWFGRQQVCRNGEAAKFNEAEAHRYLLQPEYVIRVSLGLGRAMATVLTNDLTADYVRINADYRT